MADLQRLSFNQITVNSWTLEEAINGCVRQGIPWIGLWRDKVDAVGLRVAAKLVKESGVAVSSLCRGGGFPAATQEERQKRIDDNLRAIDEAAELGTKVLVLVCGALAGRDLEGSRRMVIDGIAAIEAHARERGIKLGIEPLHPMYAADRSVIVSLQQAREMAAQLPRESVGVVIDVFHVWHDPGLYLEIEKLQGRILGLHISDWPVPLPDILMGRTMMGDGVIELARIRSAVDRAGYTGPIEVEIFNQKIWDQPGDQVLELIKRRFLECV
ncbi:MAG: sugar phosphate isomerase/epimerase family protein [Acidobacteriota bacterium]